MNVTDGDTVRAILEWNPRCKRFAFRLPGNMIVTLACPYAGHLFCLTDTHVVDMKLHLCVANWLAVIGRTLPPGSQAGMG